MFTKALNLSLVVMLILFILDISSTFETKWQALKTTLYFGVIYFPFFVLVWNIFVIKKWRNKLASLVIPILAIALVHNISQLYIMLHDSTWKTQTIVYENKHSSSKKIEFQMQDEGALGYKRRTVEVRYLTNWFMLTKPFDETKMEQAQWTKVDLDINELNLKY